MLRKISKVFSHQFEYKKERRKILKILNKEATKEFFHIYSFCPFFITSSDYISLFSNSFLSSYYGRQLLLRDVRLNDILSILKNQKLTTFTNYIEFYCPHLKKDFTEYSLILEWEGVQRRETFFHDYEPNILYHVSQHSQPKLSALATTYFESRIYSPTKKGLSLLGILFHRESKAALLFNTKINLQII